LMLEPFFSSYAYGQIPSYEQQSDNLAGQIGLLKAFTVSGVTSTSVFRRKSLITGDIDKGGW
jgi:hypothetical protein